MQRPVGATILAVLTFLVGIFRILRGLAALGVGFLTFFTTSPNLGVNYIILSIGLLLAGLVLLVLGYGLFQLRTWAWMWTVILLIIGLLMDFASLLVGGGVEWFGAGLSLVVLIYMLTSGVRSAYAGE